MNKHTELLWIVSIVVFAVVALGRRTSDLRTTVGGGGGDWANREESALWLKYDWG